jgi:LmbE family N-acetylglucosaminyl deacetylase
MRILIIAAHPDDEVLGAGGTIARMVKEHHEVYIAIMGEGITSRYQLRENAEVDRVESLHKQCREAAKILGSNEIFFYNLPDNRFDTVPLLDIVKIVEDLIERISPNVIYTHHGGDLNMDHTILNRAVITATRPIKKQQVKEIYAFEVPSSTEWAFNCTEPNFRPNIFVDISNTLAIKIKALSCYESEVRAFPHPRSTEALQAIAKRWGSVVGHEAAEAFELMRAIR